MKFPRERPLLRIGEMSRRLGVRDHVLRAGENRYGLLQPVRSPGGLRLMVFGIAARRAYAAETGASDGAWLDGDAAQAIACDAAMAPIVTGDVDVDALEDLVRLCVELDKLRQGGGPPAGTTAAWAAVEQAVIGKTANFLLHSVLPSELQ